MVFEEKYDEKPKEISLEGELSEGTDKSESAGEFEAFGRKYHLIVIEGGDRGENVTIRLLTSPYEDDTGIGNGSNIKLRRTQYENLRKKEIDIENDPDFPNGTFPEKYMGRVRVYDPKKLKEYRDELFFE